MRRGARSESTSAKVALMRMKMKAEGQDSIPQVCTVPHLPLGDLLLCVYTVKRSLPKKCQISFFFVFFFAYM